MEVLCLNHGLKFGIFATSDTKGAQRIDVCQMACHRMLRFKLDIENPLQAVWILPHGNLVGAHSDIQKINTNLRIPLPDNSLNKALTMWQTGINTGLFPEWWFPMHSQWAGYSLEHYHSFKALEWKGMDFAEIVAKINITHNPFVPEDDLEAQAKAAYLRTKACMALQYVPREKESEMQRSVQAMANSPLLEQRWLAARALRYYSISPIKDIAGFFPVIMRLLADDFYLVRKEIFETVIAISLAQPNTGFELIRLLASQDPLSPTMCFNVMKMLADVGMLMLFDADHPVEGLEDIPKFAIPRTGEYLVKMAEIIRLVHPRLRQFLQNLTEQGELWKEDEKVETLLAETAATSAQVDRYLKGINAVFAYLKRPFTGLNE